MEIVVFVLLIFNFLLGLKICLSEVNGIIDLYVEAGIKDDIDCSSLVKIAVLLNLDVWFVLGAYLYTLSDAVLIGGIIVSMVVKLLIALKERYNVRNFLAPISLSIMALPAVLGISSLLSGY